MLHHPFRHLAELLGPAAQWDVHLLACIDHVAHDLVERSESLVVLGSGDLLEAVEKALQPVQLSLRQPLGCTSLLMLSL